MEKIDGDVMNEVIGTHSWMGESGVEWTGRVVERVLDAF